MRFIHLYLIGYFVLVVGAVLALWQAGVLARVSGSWLAISMLIVFGLGIMLAVTAAKPTGTREYQDVPCNAAVRPPSPSDIFPPAPPPVACVMVLPMTVMRVFTV